MLYEIPDPVLMIVFSLGLVLTLVALKILKSGGGWSFQDWLDNAGPIKRGVVIAIGVVLMASALVLMTGPLPPRISPEAVVGAYYDSINNGDYEEAWALLSDDFTCYWYKPCEDDRGNYDAFAKSWDKYQSITMRYPRPAIVEDQEAQLAVDLEYTFANGERALVNGLVFYLVPKSGDIIIQQQWLINKTSFADEPVDTDAPDEQDPTEPVYPQGERPSITNFRYCAGPCGDGQGVVAFDGYTEEIYIAWDYGNMKQGVPYSREWFSNNELWVRYNCVWEGESSGTKEIRLYDFGVGLRGGTWEFRITIADRFAFSSVVEVNDTNIEWDPVLGSPACPD